MILATELFTRNSKLIENSVKSIQKEMKKEMNENVLKTMSKEKLFLLAFSHIFRDSLNSFEETLEIYKKENSEKNLHNLIIMSNYFLGTILYFVEKYYEEKEGIKKLLQNSNNLLKNKKYLEPQESEYIINIFKDLIEGSKYIMGEDYDIPKGMELIDPSIHFISSRIKYGNKK